MDLRNRSEMIYVKYLYAARGIIITEIKFYRDGDLKKELTSSSKLIATDVSKYADIYVI